MQLSETILSEIDRRFAEPDRAAVAALLSTCQTEAVLLPILRLCRGQVKRVEDLVQAAKRDYRDVISWASQPTRRYIVGLLRKGPNWSAADEGGRTHLAAAELRRWKEAGLILVGGWFMDLGDTRGMYIFLVDTVEEAQALVQADPGVAAGKLVFEFHPWLTPVLRVALSTEL